MVRVLAIPKTFEEQFIKKVCSRSATTTWDQGIVQMILMPHSLGPVHVAVCQDGRGSWASSYDQGIRGHLETMFMNWGYGEEIITHNFSFCGDREEMMNILLDADIFYMGGVFEVSDLWKSYVSPGGYNHCLVETLQKKVQYIILEY